MTGAGHGRGPIEDGVLVVAPRHGDPGVNRISDVADHGNEPGKSDHRLTDVKDFGTNSVDRFVRFPLLIVPDVDPREHLEPLMLMMTDRGE